MCQRSHKPVFVYTKNTPEAVVLSFEEFQKCRKLLKPWREQLGQQMVYDFGY